MQQAPDTNQKSGASAQVSPLDRTSATRTFLVRIYTLDWLVSISEENIFLLLPSSSSPCCFPAHKAALAVVADSDRYIVRLRLRLPRFVAVCLKRITGWPCYSRLHSSVICGERRHHFLPLSLPVCCVRARLISSSDNPLFSSIFPRLARRGREREKSSRKTDSGKGMEV